MIIFCPNMIHCLCLLVEKYEKSALIKESFLPKNLKSGKFTKKNTGSPDLIPNHVVEMCVKLERQCVRFEKKAFSSLVVLNWFPFVLLRLVQTMQFVSCGSFVLLC